MLELLEDLRFYIGAFFLIVGGILVLQGWLIEDVKGQELNTYTGLAFLAFSTLGLGLSLFDNARRIKSSKVPRGSTPKPRATAP